MSQTLFVFCIHSFRQLSETPALVLEAEMLHQHCTNMEKTLSILALPCQQSPWISYLHYALVAMPRSCFVFTDILVWVSVNYEVLRADVS